MFYLFLADGFEESEALVPLDILRRGALEVITVGVGGEYITGSHGICVKADTLIDSISPDESAQGIILPGGMPGTLNLENSEKVQKIIDFAAESNLLICAICAAPSILGHKGLLKGRKATCFPGYEEELTGAAVTGEQVTVDGNFITAKGAGAAFEFGFEILAAIKGKDASLKLEKTMQYRP